MEKQLSSSGLAQELEAKTEGKMVTSWESIFVCDLTGEFIMHHDKNESDG